MAVTISYVVARQIADHARADAPNEACGILAGTREQISRAIPLQNAADSPEARFRLDPNAELEALKTIDAAGLDWIGVYHSHPTAPPIPSPADIESAVDSSLLQLIVSLEDDKPKLKLWRIECSSVTPIALTFDTDSAAEIDGRLSRQRQVAIVVAGIASLLLLLAVSVLLLPPAPEITPAP